MSSLAALIAALTPRSWRAGGRALRRAPSLRGAAGKGEEHLGFPADFLIGPSGRVLAAKYGEYMDDQWSVYELLDLAKNARHTTGASPAPTGATTTPTTRRSVARAPASR
jgi:hypothetical protein